MIYDKLFARAVMTKADLDRKWLGKELGKLPADQRNDLLWSGPNSIRYNNQYGSRSGINPYGSTSSPDKRTSFGLAKFGGIGSYNKSQQMLAKSMIKNKLPITMRPLVRRELTNDSTGRVDLGAYRSLINHGGIKKLANEFKRH